MGHAPAPRQNHGEPEKESPSVRAQIGRAWPTPQCGHCGKTVANRSRRLCRKCHKNLSIRNRYATSNLAGAADRPADDEVEYDDGQEEAFHALPVAPTSALTGTPEKVAVLEMRAWLGLNLWHPLDAKIT
jgi:hypothetical protein